MSACQAACRSDGSGASNMSVAVNHLISGGCGMAVGKLSHVAQSTLRAEFAGVQHVESTRIRTDDTATYELCTGLNCCKHSDTINTPMVSAELRAVCTLYVRAVKSSHLVLDRYSSCISIIQLLCRVSTTHMMTTTSCVPKHPLEIRL